MLSQDWKISLEVVKNVLVLSCSSMCYCGCFIPLRTYLCILPEIGNISSVLFSLLYAVSACSALMNGLFLPKIPYKLVLAPAYAMAALLIFSISFYQYSVIIPACILLGLSQGLLWGAPDTYIIEAANRYVRGSPKSKDCCIQRFLCIYYAFTYTGWALGFLLEFGLGVESGKNYTQYPLVMVNSEKRGCHYTSASSFSLATFLVSRKSDYLAPLGWHVLPLCLAWIASAIALVLLFLDQSDFFPSNAYNTATRWRFYSIMQTFRYKCIFRKVMLFFYTGFSEAFLMADVVEAYIACTTSISITGYVLFSYSLVSALFSIFLMLTVTHLSKATFIWLGLSCHIGGLLVLRIWNPTDEDLAIFYVITITWSVGQTIWQILGQKILYETLQERWQFSFTIYHSVRALGMSIGFLIKPFGFMEYKIYSTCAILVISFLLFVFHELGSKRETSDNTIRFIEVIDERH
ncbi:Protein unc-93 -like protein A [Trichinella sp. T9]|nr:Protein unc-93 -like protein A [Trichinella sp. T9]